MLFLASGDLRNALYMATQCSQAYHELDIHMSDSCDIITVGNFLISQIILAQTFEPSTSPADFHDLWHLWCGLQWTETTRKRFIRDVKLLLSNQLANSSHMESTSPV